MAISFDFLLQNDALFEIVLPLVLIFAIVFAVLQGTKILGGRKNIDAIIGIVLGLLLVRNTVVVETINKFLPNVSLAIIVILMILLVLGVFLGKEYEWASGFKGLAAIASLIIVVWIFSESYWNRFGIPNIFGNLSSDTKGILVFIAILIIVVFLVTRKEGEQKKFSERLDDFGVAIFKKK